MSTRSDTQTPPDDLCVGCPPKGELQALLHGDLSPDLGNQLTEHVGHCTGCQGRLDAIATGETPVLPEAVRNIDRHNPSNQSALWRAIDRVVVEVTRDGDIPVTTPRDDDTELDFLTATDLPGRIGTFGDFEVIRMVGRGGMGVVLHAFDPCLERDVAIKVLDPELSSNKTARQRFCREARAAAAVTHENIVTVHQVNEDEKSGLPYIVMQLVNGESLEQRLRRVGKLSVPDAVKMGAQAAAGLAAAHAHGLIHRDVKPGNMLIEAGDKLKITDFGLARATEDVKLTRTGYVSGTPLYMAPEQARGDEVDARTDLFSLGVVLYEALTGKPPFEGKTPIAVLRQVSDDPHPRLSRVNPEVPEWLEDVVDGLLVKDPKNRIASAADVAQLLSAHTTHTGVTACDEASAAPCPIIPPKSLSSHSRRKYRRRLATLLAIPFFTGLALGVIGSWGFGLLTPSAPAPQATGERAAVGTVAPPTAGDALGKWADEFSSNSGAVLAADVCPDGKTLVAGLSDGSVRLFNMGDGQSRTLSEHTGPIFGVDFHPDGKRFVTASEDGTVKLWHTDDLKKSKRTWQQASGASAVAFSPNGMYLAIADRSGEFQVMNLKTEMPVFVDNHGSTITALAFSLPDGLTLATSGSDKVTRLWDIPRKEKLFDLTGHKGPVYSVAFSPCGGWVATAGWDQTVRVWDRKKGNELHVLTGHDSEVWSVSFDKRNECTGLLASAGQDGTVRLWDPEKGVELQRIKAHRSSARVVRFTTDGSQLLTGSRDGTMRLWNLK